MTARTEEVDEEARVLVTFRVSRRVDQVGVEAFAAERLADHRGRYLRFQGEIGRGLGRVERVASGVAEIVEEGERLMVVRTRFGDAERVWRGERVGDGASWRFGVCAGA